MKLSRFIEIATAALAFSSSTSRAKENDIQCRIVGERTANYVEFECGSEGYFNTPRKAGSFGTICQRLSDPETKKVISTCNSEEIICKDYFDENAGMEVVECGTLEYFSHNDTAIRATCVMDKVNANCITEEPENDNQGYRM